MSCLLVAYNCIFAFNTCKLCLSRDKILWGNIYIVEEEGSQISYPCLFGGNHASRSWVEQKGISFTDSKQWTNTCKARGALSC